MDSNTTTTAYSISADAIDRKGLKKIILEILLEDPDSEIKNLSEGFLVQYLEDAINDIENNPILNSFFKRLEERYQRLEYELEKNINSIIESSPNLSMVLNLEKYVNFSMSEVNDLQRSLGYCIESLNSILVILGRDTSIPLSELDSIYQDLQYAKDKLKLY